MRAALAAAVFATALLSSGPAAAQDPTKDGEFRVPMESIIVGLAEGTCDPVHLAPDFIPLCEEQLWEVGQALQMFGAITEMRLIDREGEGDARREIYEVDFSSGRTVKAGIGGRIDGKFTSLSFDG